MASIVTDPTPRCPGCGTWFYFVPAYMDSSSPWRADSEVLSERIKAGKRGSYGKQIAEFAARHANCPESQREVTTSGVRIVDRRRR